MKSTFYAIAFTALQLTAHTVAQGCGLEPNDPYCELPIWEDKEKNATFDDVATGTILTNYQEVSWQGLTITSRTPKTQALAHSAPNYALASTGKASLSPTADYDYIYIPEFYFGCTTSTANNAQTPSACTLELSGQCLPIGWPAYVGGQLEHLKWTYQYKPYGPLGKALNLTHASPWSRTVFKGTTMARRPVLCSNYTLTAIRADGVKPALVLDSVDLALYYDPPYGGGPDGY